MGLGEVAAAEVGRLAGLAAGMLGAGAALGVLEQAMRAALTSAGAAYPRPGPELDKAEREAAEWSGSGR